MTKVTYVTAHKACFGPRIFQHRIWHANHRASFCAAQRPKESDPILPPMDGIITRSDYPASNSGPYNPRAAIDAELPSMSWRVSRKRLASSIFTRATLC